jgi:hypothetical protein
LTIYFCLGCASAACGFRPASAGSATVADNSITSSKIADGAVVETKLAIPPVIVCRCASDFTKTNNTALAAITNLSVAVVSGHKYRFHAKLFISADSLGGWKLTPFCNGAATGYWCSFSPFDAASYNRTINSDFSGNGYNVGFGIGEDFQDPVQIFGSFIAGSGTNTFCIQFAQVTARNSSTVYAGSTLEIQECGQ